VIGDGRRTKIITEYREPGGDADYVGEDRAGMRTMVVGIRRIWE